MSVVVGVFNSRERAEQAAGELRSMGLHDRISIVARQEEGDAGGGEGDDRRGRGGEGRHGGEDGRGSERRRGGEGGRGGMTMRGNAGAGTATGAAIGGAGGLLAAAGLFAVPGVGPILALGPLAAGLTGAAAGGLVGGLVDIGVPREQGERYENQVRQGRVLAAVDAGGREREVSEVLQRNGAHEVETH